MQSCVLHGLFAYRSIECAVGHLPSPRIGTTTLRVRSVMPPPHAMEHGVQSLHTSNAQFRSHDSVLQFSDSWTVSQALPPFFAFVRIERVLTRTPPSHSFEHFDQPDHSDI